MTKMIMEASHAISEAVKMAKPAVIPAYPITPQTHIVEKIADFVADGDMDSEYIMVESEFAAMSACLGASATGVRRGLPRAGERPGYDPILRGAVCG